jgi:choline-sulfatase
MAAPNVVLIITDQERQPRHWPEEPGWLSELMPAHAELRRTGLTFANAFCSTAMCSPSRATLLTGRYPAQHGVTLTLTRGDLRPDRRNGPAVARTMLDVLRSSGAPARRVLAQFARGALQIGARGGDEPNLPAEVPTLGHVLARAGYEVAYKGKWHLTHPVEGDEWSRRDAALIADRHGFGAWEPPDAGENAEAEHFGGGHAAWDTVFTDQAVRWLRRTDLVEPFCLVVSLVNPHDVLGYPASYREGGYRAEEFRELGVPLPPTVDEDLRGKPAVHALMRMGLTAYLGPLRDRRAQTDYVNFYAHLHRLADAHIGRILDALGDPGDPASLRSRTLIVRCADHGEMGLAHGGLRQKMFNAYEETIHVPLVVSNPVLFPRPAETPALASLVDLLPTLASAAGATPPDGLGGEDLCPVLANHAAVEGEALRRSGVDLSRIAGHRRPAPSVRESVHFTFDDHQAATALKDVPGQPNRIRCLRDGRWKYGFYFDPSGRTHTEHELYDLERDPEERFNLVDVNTGEARSPADRRARRELGERLDAAMDRAGTAPA